MVSVAVFDMAVVHEMAAISDVDNVIYHFDNYVVIN